jgi:hypothetical protein
MSTSTEHEPVQHTFDAEEDRVARWRFSQFRTLGFGIEQAWLLTASSADLHLARSLAAADCPLDLAWKILL